MTFEEWIQKIHERIKSEPVWNFFGYRKALFLYELSWKDCDKLMVDRRGKAIVDQLVRTGLWPI